MIRVSVRDALPVASTIFYATPPIVLALAFGLGAVLRTGRWRGAAAVAAFGCAVWHGATAYARAPQRSGEREIVLWNACRGKFGWDVPRGDIVCLVEAKGAPDVPGMSRRDLGGGMVVFAREEIRSARRLDIDGGRAGVVEVGDLTVVVVDIFPNPLRSRAAAFASLERELSGLRGRVVVLGDFNTPRDSVHFDAWRSRYVNAWEAAGAGFEGTWPAPLPVLPIDQVWTNAAVAWCHVGSAWPPDHRPVVVSLAAAAP